MREVNAAQYHQRSDGSGQAVKSIVGPTVKMGYFAQNCEDMDLSLRAIDYIRGAADAVETAAGTMTAVQMMERFLFSPDMQWTEIKRLVRR